MANKTRQQRLFDELLDRYGSEVASAFRAAIQDLAENVDLQRLIAALSVGNLDAAISALHLDPAAFAKLEEAIRSAYLTAGVGAASTLPKITDAEGHAVVIRFDGRNLRAEAWLRKNSADLVTRILDDQRAAVRIALVDGMVRGANPKVTALDIVGRVNRVTGQREGGIIGLTGPQEEFVRTAREELTSGDAAAMAHYLTRSRRDKRFDRVVQKAIRDQTAVPADTVGKAVAAYKNRLLQLRGEVIGKKEAFAALAAGKHEAYRQAIEAGQISRDAVRKTWRHFDNEHPRVQHIAMDGQSVGMDEEFVLPDGTRMLYPHDPVAPIKHTAGCHCQADYKIDFLANLR